MSHKNIEILSEKIIDLMFNAVTPLCIIGGNIKIDQFKAELIQLLEQHTQMDYTNDA